MLMDSQCGSHGQARPRQRRKLSYKLKLRAGTATCTGTHVCSGQAMGKLGQARTVVQQCGNAHKMLTCEKEDRALQEVWSREAVQCTVCTCTVAMRMRRLQ